jgi:hypothetical protein
MLPSRGSTVACSLKSSQSNRWIGEVLAVVVVAAVAVVVVAEAVDDIDDRSLTVSQIGVSAATTAAWSPARGPVESRGL